MALVSLQFIFNSAILLSRSRSSHRQLLSLLLCFWRGGLKQSCFLDKKSEGEGLGVMLTCTKERMRLVETGDVILVEVSSPEDGDVDVAMFKDAVELINGRFETEASGNVTIETVHKIGQSGVTFISSGALTHSVKALDISLKIDTELALEVGRRTKRS